MADQRFIILDDADAQIGVSIVPLILCDFRLSRQQSGAITLPTTIFKLVTSI
jgi:hypothetical protein